MLCALILCLATVSANPEPVAEVRFVHTAKESQDSQDVDGWIKQKLVKQGRKVFALTAWKPLTEDMRRVYEGNGIFIDAQAGNGDRVFKIKAEGCAGFAISAKAVHPYGASKLYKVRGLQHTYMAIRTVSFVQN